MVFLMRFDILAKTAPADVYFGISTSSLCFFSLQYWWENAVVWWSFINVSGVTISLQYWWRELRCWRRSHRHNNTCNNATPSALAFHLIPFDNGIILISPSNPFCFSFFYLLSFLFSVFILCRLLNVSRYIFGNKWLVLVHNSFKDDITYMVYFCWIRETVYNKMSFTSWIILNLFKPNIKLLLLF